MRKAKQVYSWSDIAPDLFAQFRKKVEELFLSMVPRDVDNDYPFTYVLVDKRFETLHALPVHWREVEEELIFACVYQPGR